MRPPSGVDPEPAGGFDAEVGGRFETAGDDHFLKTAPLNRSEHASWIASVAVAGEYPEPANSTEALIRPRGGRCQSISR